MLLCDSAAEVGGKLYILGGGWSVRNEPGQVLMAVAIRLVVGWNEANEPLPFALSLVDQDGHPVDAGAGPVRIEGNVEIGRPAGLPVGSDLDSALAVTLAFPLGAGRYRFELDVAGNRLAQESFFVKGAPLAAR